GNNTFFGNDGNDSLSGNAGNDYLSGGTGNDNLYDSVGNNTLLGGDGNDYIQLTGARDNLIDGGTGVDRLYRDGGNVTQSVSLGFASDGNGGGSYAFTLPDGTTVSNIELLSLYTGSGDDQVTFTTTVPGQQFWNAGAGTDTAIVDFSAFSS